VGLLPFSVAARERPKPASSWFSTPAAVPQSRRRRRHPPPCRGLDAGTVTRRRAAVSTPAPSPAAVPRSRRRRRDPPPCRGLDAGAVTRRRAAVSTPAPSRSPAAVPRSRHGWPLLSRCLFAIVYSRPLLCIRFLGQASSRASLGFDGETCWAAANCTALRRAAVSNLEAGEPAATEARDPLGPLRWTAAPCSGLDAGDPIPSPRCRWPMAAAVTMRHIRG
jgi:hypothetical protein